MRILSAIISLSIGLLCTSVAQAGTLDDVKKRGYLQCGVSTGLAGFAMPGADGEWTGFDVDFCRAIAAAVFGDAKAVKFTPLTNKERFTALQSGEIDVLSRNTTWTFSRDVNLGLEFAAVNYYDGQGFLVPARNSELLRWCLEHGIRVVQQMTLMGTGMYQEPAGAYLPSVIY